MGKLQCTAWPSTPPAIYTLPILMKNTIDKITMMTIPVTTDQVIIGSSVPSRPMSLGGTNNAPVAGINLTNAELACIVTTSTGSITVGDSNQTGNITISTATLATAAGAQTYVQQSLSGGGQIILDDGAGSSTSLNGNGGAISLTAGNGGIVALSANNNTAEIATSGSSVTLDTAGPIGTSTNRIQFADEGSTGFQTVYIGSSALPDLSGVYLDGLGNLTLGTILGSAGAPIDVIKRTNLVVHGGRLRLTSDYHQSDHAFACCRCHAGWCRRRRRWHS